MADMACIYEMNMLAENEQLEQDILSGRGMDILFCLMDRVSTRREIAERLNIPGYSVNLYLQRLVKAGLVREETRIGNGQAERRYQLVAERLEIVNRMQENPLTDAEEKQKLELSARQFSLMTRNAIMSAKQYEGLPHKIKAYFMKAKREDMVRFREEIDRLFEKYRDMEDPEATETYSLFSVMAPYEVER